MGLKENIGALAWSNIEEPAWSYDTVARGVVSQFDVPKIVTELIADSTVGIVAVEQALRINATNVRDYAAGKRKMGRVVGDRLIEFLEKLHEKRAASVAAETAHKGVEEIAQKPSPVIVPQTKGERTMPEKNAPDTAELADAKKRIGELEAKNKDLYAEVESLLEGNKTLRQNNASLKQENEALGQNNASLKKDNEVLLKEHKSLNSLIDALRRENFMLHNALDKAPGIAEPPEAAPAKPDFRSSVLEKEVERLTRERIADLECVRDLARVLTLPMLKTVDAVGVKDFPLADPRVWSGAKP